MREKISNQKNSEILEKKSIENKKIQEEIQEKNQKENQEKLKSIKKSSLLENEDDNIKIKLSFPHNAINLSIKSENF
jgi:hypothetical protein